MFENVMSLHRAKATIIGLLEGSRANEWVVTEKLGDILKGKTASKATKKPIFRIGDRYFSPSSLITTNSQINIITTRQHFFYHSMVYNYCLLIENDYIII